MFLEKELENGSNVCWKDVGTLLSNAWVSQTSVNPPSLISAQLRAF